MSATEVREEVLSWIKNIQNGSAVSSAGERGTVIGLMNKALQKNERRHMAIAWIFRGLLGKPNAVMISTKELSDEMWWALIKWTDAYKSQDDGQWHAHGGFEEEVRSCWQAMEAWERDFTHQLGFPDVL